MESIVPPHLRRGVFQPSDKLLALLRRASETLTTIAADPKHLGARVGLTAVLHTWGSALTHHPHVHVIVPGGGLSPDGSRWIAPDAAAPAVVPRQPEFRRNASPINTLKKSGVQVGSKAHGSAQSRSISQRFRRAAPTPHARGAAKPPPRRQGGRAPRDGERPSSPTKLRADGPFVPEPLRHLPACLTGAPDPASRTSVAASTPHRSAPKETTLSVADQRRRHGVRRLFGSPDLNKAQDRGGRRGFDQRLAVAVIDPAASGSEFGSKSEVLPMRPDARTERSQRRTRIGQTSSMPAQRTIAAAPRRRL